MCLGHLERRSVIFVIYAQCQLVFIKPAEKSSFREENTNILRENGLDVL